jgi:hypothetical protein
MTESIAVTIAPQATCLRILAHRGRQKRLQTLNTPLSPWTLQAVPTLLQGLSDYQAKPLCVVLCADESGTGMLSEALSVLRQQNTSEWPIGLAVLASSHPHGADWDRDLDLPIERREP